MLQAVLEGRSDLRAALIEKLSAAPYSFKASPAHLRNVECVMTAKFERTANDVKRNAGCEVIETLDDVEDGKRMRRWRADPQFVCALADEPSFRRHLVSLTDFVLNRCRARESHRWKDTFLLLGSTYTYEDVCRLLDWDRNITSLNIGGYFYDEKTQTFPIFINYEKQAGAIAYADRFISPAELISLSKVNRQIDSQDAQRMTQKVSTLRFEYSYLYAAARKTMKPRRFISLAQCTLPQRRSPFALLMANRRLRCTGVWKRPWKRGFTSISPVAEAKAGHAPILKLPAKAARVIGCAISPGGAKRPS